MDIGLLVQKSWSDHIYFLGRDQKYMQGSPSLKTRLVLSHLFVALVALILLSIFAGRYISAAVHKNVEHRLVELAYAAVTALEVPITELSEGGADLSALSNVTNTLLSDEKDLQYAIYWPDGAVILRNSTSLPELATPDNAPELWEALQNDTGKAELERLDLDGREIFMTAVRIQSAGKVYAVFSAGLPKSVADTQARLALNPLLIVSLIIGFAVLAFGVLVANQLVKPINQLTLTAEHLSQGDLNTRAQPAGPPELQRLAEAFNIMIARIQHYITDTRSFVANASHELRTPLTVVKLRAEALRAGALNEPERAEQFLEDIEFEVDRLSYMVNDLLDLSRIESGMGAKIFSPIRVEAIATDVYETFSIRATRAGVELTIDKEPNLPQVAGNEDQIRRVLYNLVENAVKYTPRNGQVSLKVYSNHKKNQVTVLVSDTGSGIPAEHLPHLFERFYRVEATRPRYSATKGSGLGLAIAKTIVEAHGGKIGVSSQPGEGSTFWVTLPAST